jgi:hypothetical protein
MSTASITATAAVLALVLVLRPEPALQERVVYVPVPQEQPPTTVAQRVLPVSPPQVAMQQEFPPAFGHSAGNQLWQLEQQAVRWGVENWPLPPVAETSYSEPRTIRELMNDFNSGKFDRKQER